MLAHAPTKKIPVAGDNAEPRRVRKFRNEPPIIHPHRWKIHRLALLLPLIFPLPAFANSIADIIDTPFEQLLQTEVITAEKLAKQVSGAPSAVSIVTAQEIRDFGYRSLSDILDSMRGLSMTHDDTYGFMSGRGSNPIGYAGRITLLIDGYRASDNLWGQAFFGNDGILDVELIDRVEYIPGSGSSSYGDSAFLGVINVVTKKGQDVGVTQASRELGSNGLHRTRIAFGEKFDNGVDLLFSASTLTVGGRDKRTIFGIDSEYQIQKENNHRYFLKASYGGWGFESAWTERVQDWAPDTVADKNSFTSLRYDRELGIGLRVSHHMYFGRYRYQNHHEDGRRYADQGGNWWGLDNKLVSTQFDRQTIILGVEYRDDYRQSLWSQYSPLFPADDPRTQRQTWSLYAYDDLQLSKNLQLNFGGRFDVRDNGSNTFSPRAALVSTPISGTTLKLSTGIAHQQPTAVAELYDSNTMVERVHSYELVWEQALGPKTRLTSALYSYRINNYETFYTDSNTGESILDRQGSIAAKGAEFEFEHLWDDGIRLKVSYVLQDAKISHDNPMLNLANHIGKLNLSAPVSGDWLRAGLGVRYLGQRQKWLGEDESATLVADLTFTARWNQWFSSLSIRNFGNTRYREFYSYESDSYGQNRRNLWLQLGYEFK